MEPATSPLSPFERRIWRSAQVAVGLVGVGIVTALVVAPAIGLAALWNVLIPVAPALLVFAPGLWRNICPLASVGLLPRHLGQSRRLPLTPAVQARFAAAGVILLLAIVPLRHLVLNLDGLATAALLAGAGLAAAGLGLRYEWKSAWCSGLCPVHPVEKLYGTRPAVSPRNGHCDTCQRCTAVCPDSTRAMDPLRTATSSGTPWANTLLTGGFFGYVWGWFQVPDLAGSVTWSHVGVALAYPLGGLAASLVGFLVLRRMVPASKQGLLVRAFAAAAVACYYWYRVPMLFGFGAFAGDGVLVDLRGKLPEWFPMASRGATTLLFGWWFLLRVAPPSRSWTLRPRYGSGVAAQPDDAAASHPPRHAAVA